MEKLKRQSVAKGSFKKRFLGAASVANLRKSDNDVFVTKEQGFMEKAVLSPDGSITGFGRQYKFRIKKSDMFVSDLTLRIVPGGTGTTGAWVGISMIDHIEFDVGGKKWLLQGDALLMYLLIVNNTTKGYNMLIDKLGPVAGVTTTLISPVLVPLVGPGTNGVYHNTYSFPSNPAFPVGRLYDDLNVIVTLNPVTTFDSTSSTTLSDISMEYRKYIIVDDIGVHPITSGSLDVVYSYNFMEIKSFTFPGSAKTAGAVSNYDLKTIIEDGDIQYFGFWGVTDGEYDTNKDPFNTVEIPIWELKFQGTRIFHSESSQQYRNDYNKIFHGDNIFSTGKYFYIAPISTNFAYLPSTVGADGVNFLNENMILYITEPTTDTVRYNTHAYYRMKIDVRKNGTWELLKKTQP